MVGADQSPCHLLHRESSFSWPVCRYPWRIIHRRSHDDQYEKTASGFKEQSVLGGTGDCLAVLTGPAFPNPEASRFPFWIALRLPNTLCNQQEIRGIHSRPASCGFALGDGIS